MGGIMPFSRKIQVAFDRYIQSHSSFAARMCCFFKSKTHPAILAMNTLPEKDRGDVVKVLGCFFGNLAREASSERGFFGCVVDFAENLSPQEELIGDHLTASEDKKRKKIKDAQRDEKIVDVFMAVAEEAVGDVATKDQKSVCVLLIYFYLNQQVTPENSAKIKEYFDKRLYDRTGFVDFVNLFPVLHEAQLVTEKNITDILQYVYSVTWNCKAIFQGLIILKESNKLTQENLTTLLKMHPLEFESRRYFSSPSMLAQELVRAQQANNIKGGYTQSI